MGERVLHSRGIFQHVLDVIGGLSHSLVQLLVFCHLWNEIIDVASNTDTDDFRTIDNLSNTGLGLALVSSCFG